MIGVPDPDMGESVHALVVPRERTPDVADLVEHCRASLAGYKVPRSIEFRDDLGRSTMGKLTKRVLRAPYWPQR